MAEIPEKELATFLDMIIYKETGFYNQPILDIHTHLKLTWNLSIYTMHLNTHQLAFDTKPTFIKKDIHRASNDII